MDSSEKVLLSRDEVNALTKAILYLKFTCIQTDSLIFAGSPIINSALDKLMDMYSHRPDWDKIFTSMSENRKRMVIDRIDKYNSETPNNESTDLSLELFKDCIFPYTSKMK